jgi:hypothetical protein
LWEEHKAFGLKVNAITEEEEDSEEEEDENGDFDSKQVVDSDEDTESEDEHSGSDDDVREDIWEDELDDDPDMVMAELKANGKGKKKHPKRKRSKTPVDKVSFPCQRRELSNKTSNDYAASYGNCIHSMSRGSQETFPKLRQETLSCQISQAWACQEYQNSMEFSVS